jgi:hypothetical protein
MILDRKAWTARKSAGVTGLIFFGWRGSIVAILAALAVSFFLFGYWWPYWRSADMDFMLVYQAFLLNFGLPQDFFDHPGYLNILLLDGWFNLLHRIGILGVISLSDIPPASNTAAFNAIWTDAVRAGRVLSLIIAGTFIVLFAELFRKLIRDWQIAVLAAFCLAFSGGVMMEARIMRTELLTAALVTAGLLLLLIAARTPQSSFRPILVGLAAMLCMLAIANKVQAILLASALPLIVVFFGCRSEGAGNFWQSRLAVPVLLLLAVVASLLAIPAGHLVVFGLSHTAESHAGLRSVAFGYYGVYQAILAIWVISSMLVFAEVWRVQAIETAAAVLAVIAGVSLGLLALDLVYNPQNVIAAINPIEHMLVYATWANPDLGHADGILNGRMFHSLGKGVLDVLARRTFVLHTSSRPTLVLEWLVIAGAVLAWRRGQHRLFWQLAVVMPTVWVVDVFGTLRGLKIEYYTFTDPLVIIAAGWLLVNLPDLKTHRWAFSIGVAVLAIHVVVSQAEPVKHTFSRVGPERACVWLPDYVKLIERFPFCPSH